MDRLATATDHHTAEPIDAEPVWQQMQTTIGSSVANLALVTSWYQHIKKIQCKSSVVYFKRVLTIDELSTRAREVYEHILTQCPTDASLRAIQLLINQGPPVDQKISGRTIDTLVTRYPRYADVCYYLDITDPTNTFIVTKISSDSSRKFMLFDIGASYRKKMQQFSKTYFDCFGRGDEVSHIMTDGSTMTISICKFSFYIWAQRFRVFDFLITNFKMVISVRQQGQKRQTMENLLVPSRSNSILCPEVHHGKYRSPVTTTVVMRSKSIEKKPRTSVTARCLFTYA